MTYAKSHDGLFGVVYEGRVIKERIALVCDQRSTTQTMKQAKKKRKNGHREPSSNPTPQKHLHGDRLPPQPTASATQRTIIAPRITYRRRNTPPSPHSIPMVAVPNNHNVRLAARMTSMPIISAGAPRRHRGGSRTLHRV
jgi:hypothetical protein